MRPAVGLKLHTTVRFLHPLPDQSSPHSALHFLARAWSLITGSWQSESSLRFLEWLSGSKTFFLMNVLRKFRQIFWKSRDQIMQSLAKEKRWKDRFSLQKYIHIARESLEDLSAELRWRLWRACGESSSTEAFGCQSIFSLAQLFQMWELRTLQRLRSSIQVGSQLQLAFILRCLSLLVRCTPLHFR